MSDFLTRLAARAVGAPPAARPRPPALFGELEPADARRVEVVAEEEIVSRPPGARPGDPVAAPPHRVWLAGAGPPDGPVEPPARPREADEDEEGSAAPARGRPKSPDVVGEPSPPPARRAPAPGNDALELRTIARAPLPVPDPAPSAAPSPIRAVAAVPVSTRLLDPAPRAAAPQGTAPAREEPAPVRVHIGRLEIRAALEQPPQRERPPSERPASRELSLADYLRGKREAG